MREIDEESGSISDFLLSDVNMENGESKKVEIVVKTIGPTRPSRIHVHSPIKVHYLRKLVAANGDFPVENLSLILRGNVLNDSNNGQDVEIRLTDGDNLIVAIKPKPPVISLRDRLDDDDDDDLKFELPHSASHRKRKLYSFLHDKLKLPGILLMAIFSISLKMWAVTILWFILAPVAYRLELGPLFIIGTGFSLILLNLGKRQPGDVSAYSIFNEDFRELPAYQILVDSLAGIQSQMSELTALLDNLICVNVCEWGGMQRGHDDSLTLITDKRSTGKHAVMWQECMT